jgi:hypothetical protein
MPRIESVTGGVERSVLAAVTATRGHFLYLSGHHGDLRLDLDTLFVDDVIISGSATLATVSDLTACRAELVGLAS